MSTRSITCPTCTHGFSVPTDARTAICPKCGRALPILAARLTFSGEDLPRRKAPASDPALRTEPAARLARIPLRRKESVPELDPATHLDDSTSADEARPLEPRVPPAPPPPPRRPPAHQARPSRAPRVQPPPLPRELSSPAASFEVTVLPAQRGPAEPEAEREQRTGVDLPQRPRGSGIEPALFASEDLAGDSEPGWSASIGDGDIFEVESEELDSLEESAQVVDDDWSAPGVLDEVPTSRASDRGPAALPSRKAVADSDDDIPEDPTVPVNSAYTDQSEDSTIPVNSAYAEPEAPPLRVQSDEGELPEDPTIPVNSQARTPVPRAVLDRLAGRFHQDRTPSARLRALSSAIEDEVSSVELAQGVAARLPTSVVDPEQIGELGRVVAPKPALSSIETGGPLSQLPSLPSLPAVTTLTAQGMGPSEGAAPLNLSDTGIMVVLPEGPIEEVGLQKGLASVEPAPMMRRKGGSAELAPVSRRARSGPSARGHGVALRTDAVDASAPQRRKLLIGLAGGLLLVILVIVAVLLFRR